SGYGVCHVPSAPGCHRLAVATWRPRGHWGHRLLGTQAPPQLRVPEAAVTTAGDRFRLRTEAAGTVRLSLAVISRNFGRFGVAA
ncbi:B9D2 protein, partial [Grantiella picta]|nr:B9D2 protein [Grantiella picta]